MKHFPKRLNFTDEHIFAHFSGAKFIIAHLFAGALEKTA